MKKAYLLMGGNIGDRLFYLRSAIEKVESQIGKVLQCSAIYETAAWGVTDQPDFLNQAVELETLLSPLELLKELLAIELALGRERHHKWYARTIDIDILLYADQIIALDKLVIPHPRLQFRRFGLTPLAQIAPQVVHPVINKTISVLLDECKDTLEVKEYLKTKP
jgi:2-amino-4-hydroxy-6-hydroxymethyldihydropteridine diphosphokinase